MNRSRSQLLVYVALLALTSFLGFWLWQEYERAHQQLVTKKHLNFAHGIIDEQGAQLQVLMSEEPN